MTKILEDWILELKLPIEKDLSPVRLIRVGENPSFVVFGLDDVLIFTQN